MHILKMNIFSFSVFQLRIEKVWRRKISWCNITSFIIENYANPENLTYSEITVFKFK